MTKYAQQARATKSKRKVYKLGAAGKKAKKKVNTAQLKKLRDQKVKGHMKRSKEIAKKTQDQIAKKAAAGGYKKVPLRKQPMSVALKNIGIVYKDGKPNKIKKKKK